MGDDISLESSLSARSPKKARTSSSVSERGDFVEGGSGGVSYSSSRLKMWTEVISRSAKLTRRDRFFLRAIVSSSVLEFWLGSSVIAGFDAI